MGAAVEVIRWGGERARVGPWRGDGRMAQLTPAGDGRPPTAAFLQRCIDQLGDRGFSRVVTGALSPIEATSYLAAGFEVEERLHLLTHDLHDLPKVAAPSGVRMRRAVDRDQPEVLRLDHLAFPGFWRLDAGGLRDAVDATPTARFRVATDDGIVGYAITGRSGRRGFVQRLAVAPGHAGRGLGSALALDGLRWLRRWRVERAVVNTQVDNRRALALYERLGFHREATGLCVLAIDIKE